MDESGVTYTTVNGTEYTANLKVVSSGKLEKLARTNYISMSQAEDLISKSGTIGDDERDRLFSQSPYDQRGGRVLYLDKENKLRLSGTVDKRTPEFNNDEELSLAEAS